MKNKDVIKKKISEDDDYIYCPRLGNSLKNLLQAKENANGISDDRICKVLLVSKKELEQIYGDIILKLRSKITGEH